MIKTITYLLILVAFTFSCRSEQNQDEQKKHSVDTSSNQDETTNQLEVDSKTKEEKIHEKLLGFRTQFLGELGDDNYDWLEQKVKNGQIDIQYLKDTIQVSYITELNACGRYVGNLEIRNDTVKLRINEVSDTVCTSLIIEEVTFLIETSDMTNKVFLKDPDYEL